MKGKILLLFFTVVFLNSCNNKNDTCQDLMCTQQFVFFLIKFEDTNGNAVDVDDYSAVNTRTGKIISTAKSDYPEPEGYYVIADDGNITDFSKEGDVVLVSGTHMQTQVTKTAEIKITGGQCSCHISKKFGTDKIVFN